MNDRNKHKNGSTPMKAIVIDIDDTVLDFGSRLREFVNHQYDKQVTGKPLAWDLCEWLGIKEGQDVKILKEFASSWQFGALDALPGASRILTKLAQEGYEIFCITACSRDAQVEALRRANMYHCFGNIFKEIFFVEFGESKATYLNKIQETHEIHAFVDDKYDNLVDAKNAGIDNCIMIKQPHNKVFRELVTCAHDWYEISHIIQTWHGKSWSIQ
ncbi:5' nucleotidase, NT5C type [Moritella marina]|uniref:5' nucleotidase, NT5C type n=1 Tax=Moritella marina TaxID=90736 RepID=UPI003CC91FE5